MTDFTHHTPRLLSDADAAADLAGVARPVPSVGTEDARTVILPEYIFGGEAGEFEKVWDERTVRTLVSERDELAGRVKELETEVQEQCRINGMGAERELALMARVAELEAALSITNEALNKIGDYAHDRSTGPALWDPLWEIRAMAYDNMCEVDAALSATTPESKL